MSALAAGRAGLWSAFDVGFRQVAQFALAVILARLLSPADFGAAGVLVVFLSVGQALVMTAFTTSLIQSESDQEQQSTLFWLSLAAAAVAGLMLVAVGPLLGHLYGIPQMPLLALAVAGQLLCIAGYATPYALLIREGRFRAIALLSIGATTISTVVGIALGLAGAGVWALVGQLAALNLACAIGIWPLTQWRPSLTLKLRNIGEKLSFGSWAGLSATLEVLTTQGYALVLGRFYGLSDLGLYGRANNLQALPATTLGMIIGRVTLPLLSVRQDDAVELTRAFLRTNRTVMLLLLPVSAGLALTAEPLILVLFGPKWTAAAPVLVILAGVGPLFALQQSNAQLLLAAGRSALHFRVELAKRVFTILLLVCGSFFGLIGLAWAQLGAAFLCCALSLVVTHRHVSISVAHQLRTLQGIAAATAIMVVAVLVAGRVAPPEPATRLAFLVSVGAATYLLVGLGLRLPAFVEGEQLLRGLWRERRRARLAKPRQAG